MELGLAGKTVIVTGGGSNIGRGIVLAFAREGSNIVNAEIDEKQGQKVADEANTLLGGLGGQAISVRTDVTNQESVQAMVKATLDRFGRIDALVNCVGGSGRPHKFLETPEDECEQDIQLTFLSVVNCTKAVLGHMIERKYGRIINIGSPAGQSGLAGRMAAVYGGLKGGVIALSKALAWEVGRYGITVNIVVPGWTIPKGTGDVAEASVWKHWGEQGVELFSPETLQKAMQYQPIQRLGGPEDTADMVVFLASERASYVTAQTISVTGGATAW